MRGSLAIAVPSGFGVELAANFLGVDPGEARAEDLAQDATEELLNVICGQLLTRLYGCGYVFQLSIPEARSIGTERWNALGKEKEGIGFLVDDEYPALIRFSAEANGR